MLSRVETNKSRHSILCLSWVTSGDTCIHPCSRSAKGRNIEQASRRQELKLWCCTRSAWYIKVWASQSMAVSLRKIKSESKSSNSVVHVCCTWGTWYTELREGTSWVEPLKEIKHYPLEIKLTYTYNYQYRLRRQVAAPKPISMFGPEKSPL